MTAKNGTKKGTRKGTRAMQQRGIETRRAILEAARETFGRFGYQGASTRLIAATAGLEQGHLAYYFKTKELLWREVVTSYAAEIEKPLLAAAGKLNGPTLLTAAHEGIRGYILAFSENPGLTRLLMGEVSQFSPRDDWLYENYGQRLWMAAKPVFEALQEAGYLSGAPALVAYINLMSAAVLIFGCRREITRLAAAGEVTWDEEDHIRALLVPIFRRADEGDADKHWSPRVVAASSQREGAI